MILSLINICKALREVLKTSGFAFGFQHFPLDLENVNEWKTMFDPSIRQHAENTSTKNLDYKFFKL